MVYYVEDDKNIRELTLYALEQAGIEAEGFSDAESFLVACKERIPDAALLDIMLPDSSGLEILARIRADEELGSMAVMMLTARDTEADIVGALDAGADDYLAKPFGMREMVSRVRALLRRVAPASGSADDGKGLQKSLEAGSIRMDIDAHEASVGEATVKLTLREFELLRFLMENPHTAFSREDLLRRVWGWEFDGGSRTVDVHIQTLRSKLGDESRRIETVRGVGYRFEV